MNKLTSSERRLYPRIEKELPLKIEADGYGFATETLNISCIGTYCHVNKYIPPFTKVALKIKLPLTNNTANKDSNVDCKGVVVRTEDEKGGGFNIAIFFNQINNRQKQKISQYISRFLPERASRFSKRRT